MDKDRRARWMEHKTNELLDQIMPPNFNALPADMIVALRGLMSQAFERGYGWGFNDGRSFSGTGREPTYYVPEPTVQIVAKPRDVA